VGETCPVDAASIACLDSTACGSGQGCCADLLGSTTSCSAPEACIRAPGVLLCASNADCPSIAPRCCQAMDLGICSAQACPPGGFMGGNDGPGETN
jgi:hypothetical protein